MAVVTQDLSDKEENVDIGYIGKVPVRNLWLLMLYSSKEFRVLEESREIKVEDSPDNIPDLVANILVHTVDKRLKRDLNSTYKKRSDSLNRVRGKIDQIKTESSQLLSRGRVYCTFDDSTVNSVGNRYVKAALYHIGTIVKEPGLKHKCNGAAKKLTMIGVSGERPRQNELETERFANRTSEDKMMLSAAKLAFDLSLPTEQSGSIHMLTPERKVEWIRRLFEKAVGGFYRTVLPAEDWKVLTGKKQYWPYNRATDNIKTLLPKMITDIILEDNSKSKRIIIDTKFCPMFKSTDVIRKIESGYMYQIYAYLSSQERDDDPLSNRASGLLLHPSIGLNVDETVIIQGHAIRFATVDLTESAVNIRKRLLEMTDFPL